MPPIHILPATSADLPSMTNIVIAAMEYEIVIRFMFGHQHDEVVELQRDFFTSIYAKAFRNEDAQAMKVVLDRREKLRVSGLYAGKMGS